MSDAVQIPLHDRGGKIVAHALIDSEDAVLAAYRWHRKGNGYVARDVCRDGLRATFLLHREVLGLRHGDGQQGDHRNGNLLDNRRHNLRVVSPAGNAQNRQAGSGYGQGSSQFRGVTWDRENDRWCAQAQLNGRHYKLGRFDSEMEAAEVASAFRAEHMPFSKETAP